MESAIMVSVIRLSAILLSVIMMSVFMLSECLNVIAPTISVEDIKLKSISYIRKTNSLNVIFV